MMRRIAKYAVILVLCMLIPVGVLAADYWTGNGVYHPEQNGAPWGVQAGEIAKVSTVPTVYSIDDITTYSAYITNKEELIGQPLSKSFYWYNQSRLAYVKLFRVNGGQDISFLFSDNFYVYCAEFNSSYTMLNDGAWYSTGDTCTLMPDTRWIMVVFRKFSGSGNRGGGVETEIIASDIKNSKQKYIVFSPFVYTFKNNGGKYNGSTADFTKERLGVKKMTLPTPTRTGYTFKGWKTSSGKIYTGTLSDSYDANIFANTTFTAQWEPITATGVTLNKKYVILEQNVGDEIALTATVAPSTTLDKTISWSSDDESIARVDSNGKITAYNTGVTYVHGSCGTAKATCTVYVMGFDVTVPAACRVNESYEIKINVYNNGKAELDGRKRLYLDGDRQVWLKRVGDEKTSCRVLAQTGARADYFSVLQNGEYIANTLESTTVYYRLVPELTVEKPGDYEGNINFSVTVS